MRVGQRCCVVVLAALLTGCGDGPAEEAQPREPETAAEAEAAAVFREFVGALGRRDADAACRLVTDEAYRQAGCATSPRIPAEIEELGTPVGPVSVRESESTRTRMQLSARVEPRPNEGGHLIIHLTARDDAWVITSARYGFYG